MADKKWIQKAIKKPGALRKSLGIKKGEKIPAKKLAAAAKKKGKIASQKLIEVNDLEKDLESKKIAINERYRDLNNTELKISQKNVELSKKLEILKKRSEKLQEEEKNIKKLKSEVDKLNSIKMSEPNKIKEDQLKKIQDFQKELNQLLNETMTLLVLAENKKISHNTLREISEKVHDYDIRPEYVIANLANKVSEELAQLNENLEQRVKDSSDYIYRQAYFDTLTELPNRLSFIKQLQSSVGKLIILLNIDDFATINDFYGHSIGDQVLVKMSTLLKEIVKDTRTQVFKLPADEYAFITERPKTHEEKIVKIKDCLHTVEHEEFRIEDNLIHVSVTIATAVVNSNGTGFVNADMALKLARKSGQDYIIYNEDLQLSNKYRENIEMVKIIKYALNNNSIIPYFQPLLNIKTGKIDKYEALVRLIKENGEVLSPFFFLNISQKIKVYPKITEIMIEKTFTYFQETDMNFSINLSFSDILNRKTKLFLFEKIKEYDIASQLTIEILETQEIDGEKAIQEFTQEVYNVGANIAIDDFGSGYANFTHMTDIESDFMKIDGSLIKNINTDKNARLIVETIIVFARKLDKKIVAEYVHSKEVYEIIKGLGIDYAQGYYAGEPLPEILKNPILTL